LFCGEEERKGDWMTVGIDFWLLMQVYEHGNEAAT
jgi:hypothetical protein